MHDHAHEHSAENSADGRLRLALALTAGFMLVEVAGGIWSGSLALLADAAHMLTDAAALALALWARRQALRPADTLRSYGYHRMPVLAAFVNGLGLLLISMISRLTRSRILRASRGGSSSAPSPNR